MTDNPHYEDRLRRPDWPALCDAAIQRALGLCDVPGCLNTPAIGHHLTYDRFGHEDWRDVAAICPECNLLLHDPSAPAAMPCIAAHNSEWVKADPCGCPFCVYRRKASAAKLEFRRTLAESMNRFMLERNEADPFSRPAGLKREWEEGDLGDL